MASDLAPTIPKSLPLFSGSRVLSIQSHTVQGYVGNKAAVFPLQLLGFDVDPINSVQFSNHTGYKTWRGQVLDGDELWALIEGLEANGLLFYTHLLTGYIGSLSFLETILRVVKKLRAINPHLVYVCDPVMGDDGRLYIKPELVPVYRDRVIPVASLLTPNQFEAEQLTNTKIKSDEDAIAACDILHAAGPPRVVITSMDRGDHLLVIGSDASHCSLTPAVAADDASACSEVSKPRRFRIQVPKYNVYFTGTGDLMAALLLGWTQKIPNDLALATEFAVASLQAVLRRTHQHYTDLSTHVTGATTAAKTALRHCGESTEGPEEREGHGDTITTGVDAVAKISHKQERQLLELQLVQSRDSIISPPILFRAEAIL